MSSGITPAALLQKAESALSGAKALLALGDYDGACSRAYYAMFDAARASLLYYEPSRPETRAKTHSGLIAAFGKFIVLENRVARELGTAINKVEKMRILADYSGDPICAEDALSAVGFAEIFLEVVIGKLNGPPPAPV